MGLIPVAKYDAYKVSMKNYHEGQRLGVGQPRNLHLAKLEQQQVDAMVSYAKWAARRIAKFVLDHVEARRFDLPAEVYFDWIANDRNVMTRLGLYRVAEPLRPLALKAARAVVLEGARGR